MRCLHGYGLCLWRSGKIEAVCEVSKKIAAESHIARTNPNAYSIALGYLNRISKVMIKSGREEEFWKYISEVRTTNKRKIRLVEMPDGLTGRQVVNE